MNTEFVGLKRQTILQDELSLKHEEQRKTLPPILPAISSATHPITDDVELSSFEDEDIVISNVEQNGNIFISYIRYVSSLEFTK